MTIAKLEDVSRPGDDTVLPFSIENTDVRGRIVRLGPALDAALANHEYAEPVSALLGEALVLAVLLGSSIKFDGRLILQAQGDGPLSMLVADYRSEGSLRGYAQVNAERWNAMFGDASTTQPETTPGFRDLLGSGHFAITLDPRLKKDRYQGIVELTGATLAECAKGYFVQSEQVPTDIRIAVARRLTPGREPTWRAGGLMLQSLPENMRTSDRDENRRGEEWTNATILGASVEAHELTDPALPPEDVLYRLFHENGVRVYPSSSVGFACSCDGDDILKLLATFPADDQTTMVEDDGRIHVRCEFCGSRYAFDPKSVEALRRSAE